MKKIFFVTSHYISHVGELSPKAIIQLPIFITNYLAERAPRFCLILKQYQRLAYNNTHIRVKIEYDNIQYIFYDLINIFTLRWFQ